ncbi:MAG TPA: AraC family transcriptional regulator [Caulobacteraceae bacterium]|jgi:AraC-like DNA-binding protein|nr:AraC family transcriptional regulator [Caulobacteraceae bacterium]
MALMEDRRIDTEAQLRLADVRIDGAAYTVASLTPPFCAGGLTGPVSLLYLVRGGPVWLEVAEAVRRTVRLEPGTFVGLSGVVPHWFKSEPSLPVATARQLEGIPLGPGLSPAGEVELLIAQAPIETLALTNMVNGAVIVPPDEARVARRLRRAVEGIEDELRDPDPMGGSVGMVRRLSETILLNMVRHVLAGAPEPAATLGAIADVRIMRAIGAAAGAPREPWTVAGLAEVAGMSRTAFARTFHALTGETPIRMLAGIRLRAAADLLGQRGATLDEAAAVAGYGSAAAFIRAFRKLYRTTPARWRAARSLDG